MSESCTDRDAYAGTTAVRPAARFPEDRLVEWMRTHIRDFEGPLTVRQFRGGQSNPTYALSTPHRRYVLRRKPAGALVRGAHAVDREARVLAALSDTEVPVPRVHGVCLDERVIGTWFYVMDHVEGRTFWSPASPELSPEERPAVFDAMNATLAALHRVDPDSVGLSDYGRREGYVARQLARWSRQYTSDPDAGRLPELDALVDWLPKHLPESDETGILHGDFRMDNLIFHPTEPRVLAVLDWELSTLGHPVADLAYHVMMYRLPGTIIAGIADADQETLRIPTEADYISAYCARTGRKDLPELEYLIAFNMFRFAAILHGIRGRMSRGTAASEAAERMVRSLPELAGLAWQQAQRV